MLRIKICGELPELLTYILTLFLRCKRGGAEHVTVHFSGQQLSPDQHTPLPLLSLPAPSVSASQLPHLHSALLSTGTVAPSTEIVWFCHYPNNTLPQIVERYLFTKTFLHSFGTFSVLSCCLMMLKVIATLLTKLKITQKLISIFKATCCGLPLCWPMKFTTTSAYMHCKT